MISSEARQVHAAATVVDLHCDCLLRWRYLRADLARRGRPGPLPHSALSWHADFPRLRAGRVGLAVLGLPAPVTSPRKGPAVAEQLMLAAHVAMARDGRTRLFDGTTEPGELRVAFGIEGAHLVGYEPSILETWKALGVRMVGPAHLLPNLACQPSSRPSRANAPLTAHGRLLVEALNGYGLILDLAHMNARGFDECLQIHKGPVLVSHTGVASAHKLWRNVTDSQAKAIAARDGLIGIILYPAFLRGRLGASVDDVVDHIDAARRVVGVRHVAVGSDFDGGITLPAPMRDATDFLHLTDALLRRGYTAEECHAVMGGNALRVLKRGC